MAKQRVPAQFETTPDIQQYFRQMRFNAHMAHRPIPHYPSPVLHYLRTLDEHEHVRKHHAMLASLSDEQFYHGIVTGNVAINSYPALFGETPAEGTSVEVTHYVQIQQSYPAPYAHLRDETYKRIFAAQKRKTEATSADGVAAGEMVQIETRPEFCATN